MKKLTKEELIEKIENQEQLIMELQIRLETSKNGRKFQVLEILKEGNPISIVKIAEKLGITAKNVSSQLTYLRSDGYEIFTDNHGKKVLMD